MTLAVIHADELRQMMREEFQAALAALKDQPKPRIVKVSEAARAGGCHPSTVHRMIDRGQIEAVEGTSPRMVVLPPEWDRP